MAGGAAEKYEAISVFPRLVLICLRSLLLAYSEKYNVNNNGSSAGKAAGPPKYLVIMCCTMLLTECYVYTRCSAVRYYQFAINNN